MPPHRSNTSTRRHTIDLRGPSDYEITQKVLKTHSLRQPLLRTFSPFSNHHSQIRTLFAARDTLRQVNILRKTTLDSIRRISRELEHIENISNERLRYWGTNVRIANWARVTQAHNSNIFPGGPPSSIPRHLTNITSPQDNPIPIPPPSSPIEDYCIECMRFGHRTWDCVQYICTYCLTAQPGHSNLNCPECPETVRQASTVFVPPETLRHSSQERQPPPSYSQNSSSDDSLPLLLPFPTNFLE